jgi:dTDP-4-amino-4,6-dideoxygalactose transaminase
MPHIPKGIINNLAETLESRWIGQGPKVEIFEKQFSKKFCNDQSVLAVGSGTDALHLAYLLAGLKPGDEVIAPVFTCTATNIPLLYIGVKIIFADIDPASLNINVDHVRELITEKTKAIICVHYGGLPCDMDELSALAKEFGIPVIEDAAHAVGATYRDKSIGSISEFTMFSFQAIKHITTGDGGLLSLKKENLMELGSSLRWFGIDRSKKQLGIWENDIVHIGFKYQMTDISASMGLAALDVWEDTLDYRKKLYAKYLDNLISNSDVKILGAPTPGKGHAAWLFTIAVEKRKALQAKLLSEGIESNQVHYRNDRYSIFGKRRDNLPNMDKIEENYLVLPLHTRMSVEDVDKICHIINSGW